MLFRLRFSPRESLLSRQLYLITDTYLVAQSESPDHYVSIPEISHILLPRLPPTLSPHLLSFHPSHHVPRMPMNTPYAPQNVPHSLTSQ
jgi:hypothetical protein